MRRIFAIVATGWLAATAHAQLSPRNLGEGVVTEDMINTLLGPGIQVLNVRYTGATNASGVVCSGQGIIGFNSGILLTSGSTGNVVGPNDSTAKSTDNGLPGDPDLDGLIPGYQTFDAAVLEFDFIPQGNQVQFYYVFGSEEYNEFVDSSFNDVFGFFINGKNYALLPGSTTPVSINNVNNGNASGCSAGPCRNCQYYIDNSCANQLNTQLDGLTVVLPMVAPVNPGQVNHIKIAIADAGDHVLDSAVFIKAGSFSSGTSTNCVTRSARYWFTHSESANDACATLLAALAKWMAPNCGVVDLGFIQLPTGYRDDNNVRDARDAMIEALGLYSRSNKLTGEIGGTQNQKLQASKLCRARKQLAVELIAAIANTTLLETQPASCGFPADLIAQGQFAGASEDPLQVTVMTALLRKFNNSGVRNNPPPGLQECSATPSKTLRSLARDPTTQLNCPGLNGACDRARAVVFPTSVDIYDSALFKDKVNLSQYSNTVTAGFECGTPGKAAYWKISPAVGLANRQFTVDTLGSNFDTVLGVFSGNCSNLVSVACNDDAADTSLKQSKVLFQTDGSSVYYIIAAGNGGLAGSLKLRVTSP